MNMPMPNEDKKTPAWLKGKGIFSTDKNKKEDPKKSAIARRIETRRAQQARKAEK